MMVPPPGSPRRMLPLVWASLARHFVWAFAAISIITMTVLGSGYAVCYHAYSQQQGWSAVWLFVEAANYAVQTITTIGYGNWAHGPGATNADTCMKVVSLPFMLLAGVIFTLGISVSATMLSSRITRVASGG